MRVTLTGTLALGLILLPLVARAEGAWGEGRETAVTVVSMSGSGQVTGQVTVTGETNAAPAAPAPAAAPVPGPAQGVGAGVPEGLVPGTVVVAAPVASTPPEKTIFMHCEDMVGRYDFCVDPAPAPTPAPGQTAPAAPAGPSAAQVQQWAFQASTHLQLPSPDPQIGPDPSVNKWNMVAVGFPIWLWTDGPTRLSSSAAAGGYVLDLDAAHVATTFDMGDGAAPITCLWMDRYQQGSTKPGTPSPSCGHVYAQKPASGKATITATSTWRITYAGAGSAGSFDVTRTSSRTIDVGELEAVVVG